MDFTRNLKSIYTVMPVEITPRLTEPNILRKGLTHHKCFNINK